MFEETLNEKTQFLPFGSTLLRSRRDALLDDLYRLKVEFLKYKKVSNAKEANMVYDISPVQPVGSLVAL